MKFLVIIISKLFFFWISVLYSKSVTIDIFFITKAGTNKAMEFGDILTYRQTEGTASWSDSEGDYGILECMGNYITNKIEGTILKNYCKGTNRKKDIFWLVMNRNSSNYDAGIGKITYLHGTGKYKKYLNKQCLYAIEMIEGMVVLKQKCELE